MMTFVLFLTTLICSFVGSVQLGPVNIAVMRSMIQKKRARALSIGFGGALPELLYASLALYLGTFLSKFEDYFHYAFIILAPAFLVAGVYFYRQKVNLNLGQQNSEKGGSGILLGFSLGLLNPMLLPFWMVVLQTYQAYSLYPASFVEGLSFVMATAVGAFLLQYCIVIMFTKFKEKLQDWLAMYVNKITAFLCWGIAIFQVFALMKIAGLLF